MSIYIPLILSAQDKRIKSKCRMGLNRLKERLGDKLNTTLVEIITYKHRMILRVIFTLLFTVYFYKTQEKYQLVKTNW